ncbi:AAA family ATPase [Streptomyces iconiensis]|uniref:AAA family ATPase n=1 Tax=Streptomyces iconiensis TaxID=1384038 RepID=A0ABT7A999_9ACTN|nr:AAA family ATPase [Streptomyces iconiensis]MDJ1137901.1 AAA family ATPase [Streptomyces iconiensis]
MEHVRHRTPHAPADEDPLTRPTPRDVEAEALMTGVIMFSAQAYADCAEIITRDDIYLPAHQLIWDTVGGMIASGRDLHPVTVKAEIGKTKRLRGVDGGRLIDALSRETITASMAGAFAEQVANTARLRRHQEHATRVHAAVLRGEQADVLDQMHAEFQRTETARTTADPGHLTTALLDWPSFFATDFDTVQLLPGRLLAPGQQITLIGDGKAGKSLFTQEWCWRMATGQSFLGDKPQDPIPVLYVDAENGQEQIQERFRSYGAGPETMGLLRYASFPHIRPLDTAAGGADLLALAQTAGAQVVVLDTVSRFISGEENSSDTWLALYRHTLLPLKRAGIASVRLDHFGKDSTRGGRGSSAKTQDVDHVWELSGQGGGTLVLKRTHTRTGIGADHFTILRRALRDGDAWRAGGTQHVLMTWEDEPTSGLAAVPGTVEHIVASLDAAGIPDGAGNRVVRQALAERQIPGGSDKIAEAVRRRKARTEMPGIDVSGNRSADRSGPRFPETFPGTHPGTEETPGQTFPGNVPERSGTPPVPTVPPSKRGNGRGTPEQVHPEKPLCTVCETTLDPDWASRGHDTHIGCDPTTGSYPPPEPGP